MPPASQLWFDVEERGNTTLTIIFVPRTALWFDVEEKGIFDRFAIFQNKFWTYNKISLRRDKGTIALKRGNERITLYLHFPPG